MTNNLEKETLSLETPEETETQSNIEETLPVIEDEVIESEDISQEDSQEKLDEPLEEISEESNDTEETEESDKESEGSSDDEIQDTIIEIPEGEPIIKESPYIKEQYLRYGADEDHSFIKIGGTLSYLKKHGFGNNGLTQARKRIFESEILKKKIEINKEGVHYCDFCGQELGVEYDVLSDGRERCYECTKTVVEHLDEFKETYLEVKKNMEVMFGINFFASIDVVTTNAREIARKTGIAFVPSPSYDGRVLGFASDNKGSYSIHIENQSPYLCAVATIAHEMTHIWQYLNWNRTAMVKKYGQMLKEKFPNYKPDLIIYEGMAKWVEIQYLFLINETEKAYREMAYTFQRNDEYGLGFILYYQRYGMSTQTFIEGRTPFMTKDSPL